MSGSTVRLDSAEAHVLNNLHCRIVAAHQLSLFHENRLAELGIQDDVYALGDANAAATGDDDVAEGGAKRLELDAVAGAYAFASWGRANRSARPISSF